MELLLWIAGIIGFLLITTYLVKKATGAQTIAHVISIAKTTRFNSSLDGIARHKKALNAFADIGLVLAFGAIAVDYRFFRKKSKPKRIALFAVSFSLLYLFIEALAELYPFIGSIIESYFFAGFGPVIKVCFALFGFSGFIAAVLAAYSVFVVQNLLLGKQACPGIAPVIPGVQIPKVPFVVPLHAWISFLIILALHEGMHGVLARKAKIAIKSMGVLLVGILPIGAFVEPNEKQVLQRNHLDQMRFFVAGPTANLCLSLLLPIALSLFFIAIIVPYVEPWVQEVKTNSVEAVLVKTVDEKIALCGEQYGNPAFGVLQPGMQVKRIGNYTIISGQGAMTALTYTLADADGNPFEIEVADAEGNTETKELSANELGIVRFTVEEKLNPDYEIPQSYLAYTGLVAMTDSFLFWLIILNFFIAMVNFLPSEPFDGGKAAKKLLLPYLGFLGMNEKDTENLIGRIAMWLIGAFILLNALPLFI